MNILTKSFDVKEDKHMLDLMIIHPFLLYVFSDFNLWCAERNLPVVITNVVNERIEGVSVSDIHAAGRAIDISVKTWRKYEIEEAVEHFSNSFYKEPSNAYPNGIKYIELGAFKNKPEDRVLLYYHYGVGYHFHLQIRPDIEEFLNQRRRTI